MPFPTLPSPTTDVNSYLSVYHLCVYIDAQDIHQLAMLLSERIVLYTLFCSFIFSLNNKSQFVDVNLTCF